jgi:hypothetical protein
MSLRERRVLRKRRALGLVGTLFALVGVTGVGFVLVSTNGTSAYLAVLAGFACLVVAGGLSVLAWRRESVTLAGRQLRWQQVGALGTLAETVAVGFIVVPVSAAQDPLLGAVVLASLAVAGGLAAYNGLAGLQLDVERQVHLAVVGLSVLVLFLGAFGVAVVSV